MESHEVHPQHASHTGHRWFDFAMGGTALLVSCVSLYVAVHHGQIMEKLVEANSFPNVEVGVSLTSGDTPDKAVFSLNFDNDGVGPARIETIQFWDGDKPVSTPEQFTDAIKAEGDGRPLEARFYSSTIEGSLIGAGKSRELVKLTMDRAAWELPLLRFQSRFRSRVCYCSVFDDCYVTDSRESRARPKYVKKCPVPATPYKDDANGFLTNYVSKSHNTN